MPAASTEQLSSPLSPKQPTTESRVSSASYPRTHLQAAARIRHHWSAHEYAAAADYAGLAHTLAIEAADFSLAAKYAQARQLAHKYQALKVEMHKIDWQVAKDPILEPDDPPSSEARFNMVCTPDRPEPVDYPVILPNARDLRPPACHPDNPPSSVLVTEQRGRPPGAQATLTEETNIVNPSQAIDRYDERRAPPTELDTDATLCCFSFSWWRRKL